MLSSLEIKDLAGRIGRECRQQGFHRPGPRLRRVGHHHDAVIVRQIVEVGGPVFLIKAGQLSARDNGVALRAADADGAAGGGVAQDPPPSRSSACPSSRAGYMHSSVPSTRVRLSGGKASPARARNASVRAAQLCCHSSAVRPSLGSARAGRTVSPWCRDHGWGVTASASWISSSSTRAV